jgi:hypothetical protein
VIDRESAYEILKRKLFAAAKPLETKSYPRESYPPKKETSGMEETLRTIANSSLTKTIFREVTRGLFGVLMGKQPRSSSRRS